MSRWGGRAAGDGFENHKAARKGKTKRERISTILYVTYYVPIVIMYYN